ncbi:MAG: alpha-glucan family phosphorylase [Actinomycetota bacterium]
MDHHPPRQDSPQSDRAVVEPKLLELARNHRWTWHHPAAQVLDALPGADADRHPVATVAAFTASTWETLLADADLVAAIHAQHQDLTDELADKPAEPSIAYVSAEFGISELVPQYSGGLGILAGDHLKSASDLNLPLVGLGLFYREGFFRQELDGTNQAERYERCQPELLGYVDTGKMVTVRVGEEDVTARVWRLAVGRVDLYVLDTDLPENGSVGRAITDRLYSGDNEHRVQQELILGIGGLRALKALDIDPQVVHLNEGHAGFLLLEKIQDALAAGADLDAAVAATKAGSVFTTHTPVPAGIDRFERDLVARYISGWAEENDVPLDTLYAWAESPDDTGDPKPFNMAVFCLALTGAANGVSKLHGQVSRELFASVPAGPTIGSVTNGVHARTWVDPNLADLFTDTLGEGWEAGAPDAWNRAKDIDPDRVKRVRTAGRQRLIDVVDAAGIGVEGLNPEALTVGFARRFATYKRADLLLTEAARLAAMLADDSRPIQFVFAGKAHPADVPGKALMAKIVEFSQSTEANGRFIFLPDYEMGIARAMYAGCDVWLNNPIRPHEASGTSGEKSALNGGLQCSILDGWWDEMYDGDNGWAIATSDSDDPAVRDKFEAGAVYELLEHQILPLFYSGTGRPTSGWLDKVTHNWITLGPKVTATRMVADYRDQVYNPARLRFQTLQGGQ